MDQFDPQRQFVKFVYLNSSKDVWTVKARNIPDQPFVNVIDIPSTYRLGQLFKRDNVTENNVLFVDKKGRFANATNESTIQRIISYAVEENNSNRKTSTLTRNKRTLKIIQSVLSLLTSKLGTGSSNNSDELTLVERLNDKEELKKIGKTALLATTMFGLGFLFAKNVL